MEKKMISSVPRKKFINIERLKESLSYRSDQVRISLSQHDNAKTVEHYERMVRLIREARECGIDIESELHVDERSLLAEIERLKGL